MDADRLEQLIDGSEETDNLEFKKAVAWDRNTFVKDILAMANVRDGGTIIVGVSDRTFEPEGLTNEQVESYDIETMRDQIAPFADPLVIFRCQIVRDSIGRDFAVIEVSPFERTPVICRRDGADVHAGTIYFRSRARRPQSARVQTSDEMREIIEASVARTMRGLQSQGFVVEPEAGHDFDEELRGI